MSDSTATEPLPQRWLKSPFNGEAWPVPPAVNAVMYDALIKAGFQPIDDKPKAKESRKQ